MLDASILQQLVNGLSLGLVYALVAIGFTLIFGVLNVVNFAHGEIYAIGAFTGWLAISLLSPPLWLVILVVVLVGGSSGWLLERIAFRPFRRGTDQSRLLREATLLSSLAISIVVRESLEHFFGGAMLPVTQSFLLQDVLRVGPITFTTGAAAIFGLSIASLVLLQFFLMHSRAGMSIRAVSANKLGAQHVGIDVDLAASRAFIVGSMLGALAGILVALYEGSVFPAMGFNPGIKAFVAMVMGGLSSMPGAVVCAIILGVSEAFATDVLWMERRRAICLATGGPMGVSERHLR